MEFQRIYTSIEKNPFYECYESTDLRLWKREGESQVNYTSIENNPFYVPYKHTDLCMWKKKGKKEKKLKRLSLKKKNKKMKSYLKEISELISDFYTIIQMPEPMSVMAKSMYG